MAKIKLSGKVTATNPITGKSTDFDLSKSGWLSSNGYFNLNTKLPKYAQKAIAKHLKNTMGKLLKGVWGTA